MSTTWAFNAGTIHLPLTVGTEILATLGWPLAALRTPGGAFDMTGDALRSAASWFFSWGDTSRLLLVRIESSRVLNRSRLGFRSGSLSYRGRTDGGTASAISPTQWRTYSLESGV